MSASQEIGSEVAHVNERIYIWSEEPAGWGPGERARFDKIFRALYEDERLAAAFGAFHDGTDELDGPTLLVEVATVLTSEGFRAP